MTALSALLALALAGQPAASPAGDCELHVWPADGLTSIFYGMIHGGIVNGGQQGRRGYPRIPADAMTAAIQADQLTQAGPQNALGLANYRLVVHADALPSRTIRTAMARISDSHSTCYAELMVDDVVLQQDWVNGAKLRVLYRYRDFGADAWQRTSFTTWADTNLSSFPPTTEADLPRALTELRAAFRGSILVFANQYQRSLRRRR
jgi:hypothetical protein